MRCSETRTPNTRMVRLFKNEPGAKYRMHDGATYAVDGHGIMHRTNAPTMTKKQRNKLKKQAA